jgi:uncharacterized protein YbjT (DUF2867 family)
MANRASSSRHRHFSQQENAMFVVTGATGNTGRVVAERLLNAGQAVRLVVRDRAKASTLAKRGAEVVVADLHDESMMANALRGAAGAYLLSPPDPTSTDFIGQRKQLTAQLARAAQRAEVQHLVLLSSISAQHAAGTGPIVSVHHAEAQLRATGLPTTFLRAAYFVENFANALAVAQRDGVLPSFVPLDQRVPMVATRDIGAAAAQALLEGPRGQRIIELSSAIDASARDVAQAFSRILGRAVQPVFVPLEAIEPTLTSHGVSPQFAALMREMYGALTRGDLFGWDGQGERMRGPTLLDEALRALVER